MIIKDCEFLFKVLDVLALLRELLLLLPKHFFLDFALDSKASGFIEELAIAFNVQVVSSVDLPLELIELVFCIHRYLLASIRIHVLLSGGIGIDLPYHPLDRLLELRWLPSGHLSGPPFLLQLFFDRARLVLSYRVVPVVGLLLILIL